MPRLGSPSLADKDRVDPDVPTLAIPPDASITTTLETKTVAIEFSSKNPALSNPLPVVRYKPETDGMDDVDASMTIFSKPNHLGLVSAKKRRTIAHKLLLCNVKNPH